MPKTFTLEVSREVGQEDIDIVTSLSMGLKSGQIATKMNINPRTMEVRIDQIKKECGANTHAHLVAIFLRNKIID